MSVCIFHDTEHHWFYHFFVQSHLIMHWTIGLTDYYRTISDGLTGYRTIGLMD